MNLGRHRALDALCGEYLLGTLRGPARRRFERALREDSLAAGRLSALQRAFTPVPAERIAVAPRRDGFARLARELALPRPRSRWYEGVAFWRGWAIAATAALAVAVGLALVRPEPLPVASTPIATLRGGSDAALVTASLSRDGRTLLLRAARPVEAGPRQSYELWLVPAGGAAPVSIAVLGTLDARVTLREPIAGALRAGSNLAISVEPAGGSPTGAPTGPVLLSGPITS